MGSISLKNGHKKGWASTFHKRKERGFAALMTTNEEYDFAFDKDINRLKEKLGIKTQTNFHFDKLNDIHDNDQVQIGR